MIIDFHTHCFPDSLVGKAIPVLSARSNLLPLADGTLRGLELSMNSAGVDYAVVMPVCTSPGQEATINRVAIETNERTSETGILSFGGIHPDNTDYKNILRSLSAHGVKGIKLHPVFQETNLDDLRFLRIIDCACENGLIVLTHGGYDISFPGRDQASPQRIRRVWDTLHPEHLVAAHLGGWAVWNDTMELLADTGLYLDTSFCLAPQQWLDSERHARSAWSPEEELISKEMFLKMVHAFGASRFLMGSDSPWTSQKDSIEAIRTSGLTDSEIQMILGGNATWLLGL